MLQTTTKGVRSLLNWFCVLYLSVGPEHWLDELVSVGCYLKDILGIWHWPRVEIISPLKSFWEDDILRKLFRFPPVKRLREVTFQVCCLRTFCFDFWSFFSLKQEHGNDGFHLLNNDFRHSSCTLMISFNPHHSSVNEALLSVFPVHGGERQSLARLDKSFKWKSVLNLEWSNAVFTASPRLNCSYGIWPRLWCGLPYTTGFRSTLLLQPHAHLPAIPSGYLKSQTPFNLCKWKESNSCRMCFATMSDYKAMSCCKTEEFSLLVSRTMDWGEQSQGEVRDLAVVNVMGFSQWRPGLVYRTGVWWWCQKKKKKDIGMGVGMLGTIVALATTHLW